MSLSNKEQTLFLRDSTLFLLKDGVEYPVENPGVFKDNPIYWASFRKNWDGGVEIIKQYKRREGWADEPTARDTIGTDFARLLPKEEKKDNYELRA